MSRAKANSKPGGVAFEVRLDGSKTPKSSVPKRLVQSTSTRPVTPQTLAEKQMKAEERRKAHENARLERIQQRHEDCLKVNSAVESLLAQDSLAKGEGGTEEVRPMTRQEAREAIKDVKTGLAKIRKN